MNLDLIKICKPTEWIKNLLIFIPLVFLYDQITQMLLIVLVPLYFYFNILTSSIYSYVNHRLSPQEYKLNELTRKVLAAVLLINVHIFGFMVIGLLEALFFCSLVLASRWYLIKYKDKENLEACQKECNSVDDRCKTYQTAIFQ